MKRHARATAGSLCVLAALVAGCGPAGERAARDKRPLPENGDPDAAIRIDRAAKTVLLKATVHPDHFRRGPNPHHHLVTWRKGSLGHNALFATEATDSQVLAALKALGGAPGNNLTRATWEEADNPDHPDPDLHAAGDPVSVRVVWDGLDAPMPVRELFAEGEIDLVFAGNGALIPVWESGCVVCMQSCPGGKIANAPYTMREYVRGGARLRLKDRLLPADGTEATILIRLEAPPPRAVRAETP
jgi:hypothetical protein